MNSIKGFMNGMYKVIAPALNALFALFLTIAGNYGFQAYKATKENNVADIINTAILNELGGSAAVAANSKSSGGTGFATFLQVLMWIIAVVYIGAKVLETLQVLSENPGAFKSLKPAAQTQTQQFAQPAQAVPQPAAVPTPAADGADQFCTQCGAKVPAGNAFCTGCGAKMN